MLAASLGVCTGPMPLEATPHPVVAVDSVLAILCDLHRRLPFGPKEVHVDGGA